MSNYRELLKDPRWQKKRLFILERDGWQCQFCPDKESTLHVHHTKYFPGDPWDTPDGYLVTLCESCHESEERMKMVNLYDLIAGSGLTRMHIEIIFEHIRYYLHLGKESGLTTFESYLEITGMLVPKNEASEYIKWLSENRRKKHG
jgi:hypothetical protein